jgi:protein TilB
MKLLHEQLCTELEAEGVDVAAAQLVENDGLSYSSDEEPVDLGYIDPEDGTFKRPWCPATRILEHRENEKIER